jgi:hypothetical protein
MKEMKGLEDRGIPVRERLLLSEACPLILDYHVALDVAREKARGAKAIGTTGRGIGPAYEDKVARRGLRVGDLFDKATFAEKLKEVMEYHNFQLVNFYKADAVDYQKVLDDVMAIADILTGMVVDVSDLLDQARKRGDFVMFEGAQGTLLDIDHGTYPYVTSSNTTAGGVATGSGYEAPVMLAYSARNRSASIRIPVVASPKARRIEVRFPDPAANPYLCFAALLMAGLDGIKNKIHPGEAMDKNLYDLPPEEAKEIPQVAGSLEEALNALRRMPRAAPILRRKPAATIWCAPGSVPMVCRRW